MKIGRAKDMHRRQKAASAVMSVVREFMVVAPKQKNNFLTVGR